MDENTVDKLTPIAMKLILEIILHAIGYKLFFGDVIQMTHDEIVNPLDQVRIVLGRTPRHTITQYKTLRELT